MTNDELQELFFRWEWRAGGRGTRVPSSVPIMLRDYSKGLTELEGEFGRLADHLGGLLTPLQHTCAQIRRPALELVEQLRQAEADRPGGWVWSTVVAERYEEGELPFDSSEILPVVQGQWSADNGRMKHGRECIVEYAKKVESFYDELWRYGPRATEAALALYHRSRRSPY